MLWRDTQRVKSVFILSSVLIKMSSRSEKYRNEGMYD
ncbi:multidrug transporter [Salmonella enterica subsp. enterica]|nr:multidrug transporter [Salmonella enterica subsp. enterica]